MPQLPLTDDHVDAVLRWYEDHGRDLPWRSPQRSAWGVLVCEVMSQQTPVPRIVAPWRAWLARWPEPASLAADSPGEAVRMWGRLGYPRRALRLHAAAAAIVERHQGQVPRSVAQLLALPGIGAYTAAATAAFGFGVRTTVLDVNVRRVLARVSGAAASPVAGAPTRFEVERAEAALPADPARAARWNASVMELGALVCTARAPRCPDCPLSQRCPVPNGGQAALAGARTGRTQPWVGSDRYVRGLVMAGLRAAPVEVGHAELDLVWPQEAQLRRCIAGLTADGLAVPTATGLRLPGLAGENAAVKA